MNCAPSAGSRSAFRAGDLLRCATHGVFLQTVLRPTMYGIGREYG